MLFSGRTSWWPAIPLSYEADWLSQGTVVPGGNWEFVGEYGGREPEGSENEKEGKVFETFHLEINMFGSF